MMLLFFLSGIFFRFDAIPESLRPYFDLNPIAVIIHAYREVLIAGQPLEWSAMWPVAVMSVGFLTLGGILLKRWDRIYAKRAFL
jgi:lipopolysaccharide transport system permease protein